MLSPTTSPELFTALAKLVLPPSVPRSTARNAGDPALSAAATPVVKTKSAASAKTAARAWAKPLSIGKPLCSRRPHASVDCPSDDRSDPDPGHPPKEGARRPWRPQLGLRAAWAFRDGGTRVERASHASRYLPTFPEESDVGPRTRRPE